LAISIYLQQLRALLTNEISFFLCWLNRKTVVQETNARQMHVLWMMLQKQGHQIFKC